MNNTNLCQPNSFDRLKQENQHPVKIMENQIDRALKALHFKLVDDLHMIIWYVTSSL